MAQQKTDVDIILKAIDFAIEQSEFGTGNATVVYRRCACRQIRPEKVREYIARLQADKKIESIVVGSDLFFVKPFKS